MKSIETLQLCQSKVLNPSKSSKVIEDYLKEKGVNFSFVPLFLHEIHKLTKESTSRLTEAPETIEQVLNLDTDRTTQRRYWFQENNILRFKCTLLLLWAPLNHLAMAVKRGFRLVTAYHFRKVKVMKNTFNPRQIRPYPLLNRLQKQGSDLLKIAATPFLVIALELSALYGIVFPKDGRKLYASVERLFFSKCNMKAIDLLSRKPALTAPCFQPEATHHALGGDTQNGNNW